MMLANVSNPTCFFRLCEPLVAGGTAIADVVVLDESRHEWHATGSHIEVRAASDEWRAEGGATGRAVQIGGRWVAMELSCE